MLTQSRVLKGSRTIDEVVNTLLGSQWSLMETVADGKAFGIKLRCADVVTTMTVLIITTRVSVGARLTTSFVASTGHCLEIFESMALSTVAVICQPRRTALFASTHNPFAVSLRRFTSFNRRPGL